MAWNDKVNVCGGQSQSQAAANTTSPVPATILINIDKTKQRMTVSLDGVERYNWPVSTGMTRYSTPSGTYTALSMNEIWYSKEWDNAPMPHAIFFMKDGHAIHGSYEVKNLGKPASHGCVRIAPQNAATLYTLVAKTGLENTQVVLAGLTPGGEGKVASGQSSGSRYGQTARRSAKPGYYYLRPGDEFAQSDNQPQRRGGFFRRLFSVDRSQELERRSWPSGTALRFWQSGQRRSRTRRGVRRAAPIASRIGPLRRPPASELLALAP
jgi:hypothetical protein